MAGHKAERPTVHAAGGKGRRARSVPYPYSLPPAAWPAAAGVKYPARTKHVSMPQAAHRRREKEGEQDAEQLPASSVVPSKPPCPRASYTLARHHHLQSHGSVAIVTLLRCCLSRPLALHQSHPVASLLRLRKRPTEAPALSAQSRDALGLVLSKVRISAYIQASPKTILSHARSLCPRCSSPSAQVQEALSPSIDPHNPPCSHYPPPRQISHLSKACATRPLTLQAAGGFVQPKVIGFSGLRTHSFVGKR
ncbi:hypothetical protein M432DRAFT_639787 [Thermoascus aurantiacus ATCC 26904]